tara:strand:+ start:4127 stop:4855 length:729 start_codon:yes stop_codon:yes gene_type:complete
MIKSQRFGQIKGVLFDKDGTLFDYYRTWVPILQSAALLAARGDEAMAARLLGACGFDAVTGRVVAGGILAAGNTIELAGLWRSGDESWDVLALTRVLDDHFAAEAPLRSAPVTDLVDFFRGLRATGYRTGIATNDNEASALATVTRFKLAAHVEFVYGYDSGHGAKPEPGMIHAFCAATGLEPSQVAMVGDNFHDLEMARRAGAGLKVGVLTGTSLRADLAAHADVVLDSIAELPAYLASAR